MVEWHIQGIFGPRPTPQPATPDNPHPQLRLTAADYMRPERIVPEPGCPPVNWYTAGFYDLIDKFWVQSPSRNNSRSSGYNPRATQPASAETSVVRYRVLQLEFGVFRPPYTSYTHSMRPNWPVYHLNYPLSPADPHASPSAPGGGGDGGADAPGPGGWGRGQGGPSGGHGASGPSGSHGGGRGGPSSGYGYAGSSQSGTSGSSSEVYGYGAATAHVAGRAAGHAASRPGRDLKPSGTPGVTGLASGKLPTSSGLKTNPALPNTGTLRPATNAHGTSTYKSVSTSQSRTIGATPSKTLGAPGSKVNGGPDSKTIINPGTKTIAKPSSKASTPAGQASTRTATSKASTRVIPIMNTTAGRNTSRMTSKPTGSRK